MQHGFQRWIPHTKSAGLGFDFCIDTQLLTGQAHVYSVVIKSTSCWTSYCSSTYPSAMGTPLKVRLAVPWVEVPPNMLGKDSERCAILKVSEPMQEDVYVALAPGYTSGKNKKEMR